jgi:hypothetical protein
MKLGNGVKMQLLASGSGREAQVGDRVLFDYVLRRSNGYFIYGFVLLCKGIFANVSLQNRCMPKQRSGRVSSSVFEIAFTNGHSHFFVRLTSRQAVSTCRLAM